nr:hypothetical protein [Crucivirus sp.]
MSQETSTNIWAKRGCDDIEEAKRLSRGWGLINSDFVPVIDLTMSTEEAKDSIKEASKKRKRNKLKESKMSVSIGEDDTWSETPDSVSFDEDFKEEFLPFLEKWMNTHGRDYIENWLIRQDLKLCTGHSTPRRESSKLIQQPNTEKPTLMKQTAFSLPRLVKPKNLNDCFGQHK